MLATFDQETSRFKGRVHCFSMQVKMNKCSPKFWKKFGSDPSYHFRKTRKKRTFNSKKWRQRAKGEATLAR